MLTLALRNFVRHRTRYQVLLTILVAGAALGVVLLGVSASLTLSLGAKAELYFGGDLAVVGSPGTETHLLADPGATLSTVDALDLGGTSLRTVSYNRETILFSASGNLKQRRLIGVDPRAEARGLASLDFDSGGPEGLAGGTGIVISRVTADKLRVGVGDQVTLMTDTVKGSRNTLSLVVSGVFHDTSFFGFSSYLSRSTLNRALDLPAEAATEVGVELAPGAPIDPALSSVQKAFGPGADVSVVTLKSRLAQIQDILDALTAVSTVLTGLFLAIAALGVANTIQSVLVERTREIGAMRALGMGRGQLVGLVLAEVGWLALVSGVVGGLVGMGALGLLTAVDWGSHPLATMFLHRGHLAWAFPWQNDLLFFSALVAFAVVGAVGAARKAAHWKPVDALRYHS